MKFTNAGDRAYVEDLFNKYMADLPANFYRNQFELATQYGNSYEDWVRMLKHPAFDSWKSEQIAIIATAQTDKALAGGDMKDKEAVNLLRARQDILKDENANQKPIVIVIPESLFFNEEK